MTAEIFSWALWAHREVMPWLGYVTLMFLLVLGPLWLVWAIRLAIRSLRRRLNRTFGREDQPELPGGLKGGEGFVSLHFEGNRTESSTRR